MAINALLRATARIVTPTLIGAAAVLANVGSATAATPAHIQPASAVVHTLSHGAGISLAAPPSNVCTFTSNRLVAHRKDGKQTVVVTNGSTVSGFGNVYLTLDHPTALDTTYGTANGALKNYHISFTVTPNYAGAKSEQYEGEVDIRGGIVGWMQGNGPSWKADAGSVKCTSGSVGGTSTVTADVDVYSKPGGDDRFKTGFLRKGTEVHRAQGGDCPRNNWCHITGSNVPGGDGYAWGSFFKTNPPR